MMAHCLITNRAAATIPRVIPKLKRRRHPPHVGKQTQEGGVSDTSNIPVLTESLKQKTLQRRKSRPFAGRKNKEGREKAVEDHRAVGLHVLIKVFRRTCL